MKKIFAIALAVVMVLSMASAFAVAVDCETLVFDWTCKTPATYCGKAKVEVVPYVKVNTACGWEYQVSDCASAIRSENVYFALKLTVDAYPDQDWFDGASFDYKTTGLALNWDAEDQVDFGGIDMAAKKEKVYYHNTNGAGWVYEEADGFKLANYVYGTQVNPDDDVCSNEDYDVCVTLKSYNNGIGTYVYGDYTIYTDTTKITVNKGDKWVDYKVNADGVINEITGSNDPDFIAEVNAFLNLGCAYGVCVNADNLEAIFGWDYEQKDCFSWSTKGASVVDTDCVVAIPKTGDASVLAWLF